MDENIFAAIEKELKQLTIAEDIARSLSNSPLFQLSYEFAKEDLEQRQRKIEEMKKKAKPMIDAEQNPVRKKILVARYIQNKPIDTIACMMHLGPNHVRKYIMNPKNQGK